MTEADNIKNVFKNANLKTNPKADDAVLNNILQALEGAQKSTTFIKPNIWRIIMKSTITKLAVAAVVIIAVAMGITFLEKTSKPAYAIEQTIEAMKNIKFMHVIRRNDAGKIEDERWIEIGSDGSQMKYRQDSPPSFFVVDNCNEISVYHKDKNTMLLSGPEGERYSWISNPGKFLQDLAGKGSVKIVENIDYRGRKAHKVLWLGLNVECYIDAENNLPIALCNEQISYETPPEGTFDITIPDGVTVIDKRIGAQTAEEPQWMQNGSKAQKYFDQGRQALAIGNYENAINLLNQGVELQPGRNWSWFLLGKAYYEKGDYSSAINIFTKFITEREIVPHYLYLARGFAYQKMGNAKAAKDDFGVALPMMILSLRNAKAAMLFDLADDPLRCADGYLDEGCTNAPDSQQSFTIMLDRLKKVTGQNFAYDPNGGEQAKEKTISDWENWWAEHASEYGINPK